MAQSDTKNLVTDPYLLSILRTSTATREASLALLRITTSTPSDTDSDSESHNTSIIRAQKNLHAHLSRLRGQNRRLAHLVRSTKAHTSASKSEIDTLHLSLQNLYYESRHLAGEIASCEMFPHKYMALPMISEDAFLSQHPEWSEKRHSDAEGEGESALMEARIEKEYKDRLALEEQRKKLVARKAEMMKENAKRKEELEKIDAKLEKYVEDAGPITEMFEKALAG